ncbi:MAG: ice-binding family protein [Candidatus Paceibacterota bacterium]
MRKNIFNRNFIGITLVVAFVVALTLPLGALAATSPSLGTADPFAILSDTFTRNVGVTGITGNVGYTTLSGSGSDTVTGTTFTPAPPQTGLDQNSALANLNAQVIASCNSLGGGAVNLDNAPGHVTGVYNPGCYSSGGAMNITTNTVVTLDGAGTYIFKANGALTTQASTSVILINGASACDVFWIPVGATTIGSNPIATTTPTFVGNIFRGDAAGLSITLGHFANILGKLLAFGSTVTADTNTIAVPSCGVPAPGSVHIIKNVVGGTAVPSNFSIHLKLSGTDVAGSPAAGTTTPGTFYFLSAGNYVVSEDPVSSYKASYGTDCDSVGNLSIPSGGSVICTVTNTYTPPYVASGHGYVGGSPSFVSRTLPQIGITKVPTPQTLPVGNNSVVYNYTVWNVGKQQALANVTVTDDKCATIKYLSGDLNNDGKLDINENWKFSCTTKLSKTTTNTAVATGYSDDSYHQVATSSAVATVRVTVPGLPNTGFAPEEEQNILGSFAAIVGGLSVLFLSYFYFVKKNKIV